METLKNQSTTYVLKLSEEEARWLKGLVQNPIGCSYEEEAEKDRKMRCTFWDSLTDVPN